ncbi:MAG: hypothetical protein HOB41_03990 [Gemmatimonadetes bacterium]|nr:hypothetical protein [Gemmatimonadota bacterium]
MMRRGLLHFLLALVAVGAVQAAKPVFENKTPVGFSPHDSTTKADFVVGSQVSLRVDLDQAATYEYPVVGHFHGVEKSDQVGSTDTDGMQVDIAMVDVVPFGVNDNTPAPGFTSSATHPAIHMAWIEQTTTATGSSVPYTGGATPLYRVMYARSFDGGGTFDTAVAVTGNITYHLLSTNVAGTGTSFSTLDLEVDSGGQPRIVYSFVSTADHERQKNIYLAYSTDGGGTWETPIQVNDTKVTGAVEGRNSAFPRMVVDDRDNMFISYVRGSSAGTGGDDIMLAKVNSFTSPFSVLPIGESGTAGTGGIRLTIDADRATGQELAVGDGDALHMVYFNDNDDRIEHKRLATDNTWLDVSAAGWSQNADGSAIATFDDEVNNGVEEAAHFYFPALVVDRKRLPDQVYSVFKFANGTPFEGVWFNTYSDSGAVGVNATWGTAASIWKTASPALFADGTAYNAELDWTITERVAAVVDDRQDDRGDLHIAFSAGFSFVGANATASAGEHDIYYARYNGTSWTLPEKVADDDSDGTGTEDGIATTDIHLLSPALAQHPDESNIYLAFAGGTGEGFGINAVSDVNHHSYFKVLGQTSTYEDDSIPVGAYQYTLSYTPVNAQNISAPMADNPIYVHVADSQNGTGLGAQANLSDGFLAGDWETVGSSLADDDKFYEGLTNEDTSSLNEWGDDDDKIGLLVKLNVLGSDSSTNLQAVTNSTASAVGTGLGARTVTVGTDPSGSFVAAGSYFLLGADINIVTANSAPTVSVAQPDGVSDLANTSFSIEYSAEDGDDSLGGNLKLALYAYPTNGLKTVQDIRIFGTLIVDENDVSTVNSSGTNDLTEGAGQTYTWDDPPTALKSSLFASILRVPSGSYYIYVVGDDQKNPPVFAVSSGVLTLLHRPVIQQIDPIVADTVDTGVRTGIKASPYDLDFSVVDYDSEARVQLFYASVSGITTVSATGNYPRQEFVLGKSLSGTRGTAITDATTMSTHDKEFSWDVSSPLVAEGNYYLYAVATDSISVSVDNSSMALVVKHSPAFTFYDPAKDTQRSIDSGSQPVYTIQWQKGPGDKDLDHDASVVLYFTTDNPSTIDHSTEAGASSTSLTGDTDTQLIISGLTENSDGKADMYVWDLRNPPNAVPKSDRQVWLYAVTTDGSGNTNVVRGGSLTITHNPFIQLNTRLPGISQGDILRFEWDDYMVDDASGTDDAYVRIYAAANSNYTTLQGLEADVDNGGGNAFILNSSDGTASGTINALRESGGDSLNWDTKTSTFTMPIGVYTVYAGISADATFSDNTLGRVSKSSNELVVGTGTGSTPLLSLSPNKLLASSGDTLTFEILVQSNNQSIESISAIIDLGSSNFSVINSGSPFTDFGEVFSGGVIVENTSSGTKVRFTKNKTGGEIVGSGGDQKRLASFQVAVQSGFSGVHNIVFDASEAALSMTGSSNGLKQSTGLSVQNAKVQSVARGRLLATVLLEGRTQGNGDHSTLLDVHLRLPGSTIDITDATFIGANDTQASTTDTVEVLTTSSGGLMLGYIPAGRYVLTVKDSSHLSGRTDTLAIRNGETITLSASSGFFSSDIRGDKSFLLEQGGRLLKGGDATGDNEIDEDDVNTIDAAWGTNTALANFAQADVTNDGRVGIEDLSMVASNISNSTGFGAPPVYKRAVATSNTGSALEVIAPDFAGEWRAGEEVELVFMARGLGDLAGYEMEFSYDPFDMSVVGEVEPGAVFAGNPQGAFQRLQEDEGRIRVAGARYGKVWSAAGDGELLRVKVRLHQDGFPESLSLQDGRLISSAYESAPLEFLRDPSLLAVPDDFALSQNYPNPFNPSTTIPFSVPAFGAGMVPTSVEIFNAIGQRVKVLVQESVQPGYHRAVWTGDDAAGRQVGSGIYFYRVKVGESLQVRRMTLVK